MNISSTPSLSGKWALVTGGAIRIGREISLALAHAGVNVAFTYRRSAKEAEDTARAIARLGVRSLALPCDLRDQSAVHRTLQKLAAEVAGLDLLINNAGVYQTRDFGAISIEDWDEMFAVNVRAAFLMTQGCATQLRATHGRIVNIGSLGGIRPWATHAHYCASKAALHMLTQASAKALAPEVAVNCVAPGMIDQGESEHSSTLAHFRQKTPLQKNGSAADVAQAVMFFATCPEFITGQILGVDGGLALS